MSNFILGDLDTKFKVGSADCRVYLGDTCVYSGDTPTPHDYSQDYLTFRALEDGTFSFGNNIEYSLDSGSTWVTLPSGTASPTVTSGNTILWKASGLTPTSSSGIGTFSSTRSFEVEGNIMSLLYGDNFVGQVDLSGKNYAFIILFKRCTKLINAENLVLPAMTLAEGCYKQMFTVCSSLTTAPVLPAKTLTKFCYQQMFDNCTSLNSVTCLATDISATYPTYAWLNGVAANGTFTKAASMSSWTTGNNGIPSGWTVVDYSG